MLTPEAGPSLESGLWMKKAVAGTRGEWAAGGLEGFGLAADLMATEAAVSRVGTALEGFRGFTAGGGRSQTPAVEVGLRHDAGDAEAGSILDIGGGLTVRGPVERPVG